MIVNYIDKYFDYLSCNISEFDINYLKNDIPVGLISYSLIYDRIELEYIWVKSDFRGMGIASKLMDKMLSEDVSNVTLEVCVTNEKALNLYKKYSFKVVSIRKNYYGNDDAYLMIREMI